MLKIWKRASHVLRQPKMLKIWKRASHVLRQAATRKQTALQTTKLINPVKPLRASDLGIHRTWPNDTDIKSNFGRWAHLGISKGTEAAALSSMFIRLHLGHLNAVDFFQFGLFIS
jgi:hypothetical protein